MYADKFRDPKPLNEAWGISCMFCYFAPEWQTMMTAANWKTCWLRFSRGGLDEELPAKSATQVPELKAEQFRFLQSLGCDTEAAPTPIGMDDLEHRRQKAHQRTEEAELDEFKLLLQQEVARYMKHQEDEGHAQTFSSPPQLKHAIKWLKTIFYY